MSQVAQIDRPLAFMIVSGGGTRAWLQPNDLLHTLMAAFIIVVGHVLATGIAIAEDNRQIV